MLLTDITESYLSEKECVLELIVNNHPGVMSHICGLFARRAFNVEKIICFPLKNRKESKIYLTAGLGQSLGQMIKQLLKLEDVHQVKQVESKYDAFLHFEKVLMQEPC